MKLIALTAAALIATASATTTCKVTVIAGNEVTANSYKYVLDATDIPDRSGICGGLWSNLDCWFINAPDCSGDNGNLHWEFVASSYCSGSSVNAAWWYATKNQWGSVHC